MRRNNKLSSNIAIFIVFTIFASIIFNAYISHKKARSIHEAGITTDTVHSVLLQQIFYHVKYKYFIDLSLNNLTKNENTINKLFRDSKDPKYQFDFAIANTLNTSTVYIGNKRSSYLINPFYERKAYSYVGWVYLDKLDKKYYISICKSKDPGYIKFASLKVNKNFQNQLICPSSTKLDKTDKISID